MPSFRAYVIFKDHALAFGDNTPKFRYMKEQITNAVKQYGDGLKHLESMTIKCGTELLQSFEEHGPNAFDPYDLLRTFVVKSSMNLVYGISSQTDIDEIVKVIGKLEELIVPSGVYMLLDIFPVLRFIVPSMMRAYRDLLEVANKIHKIGHKLTTSRQKILNEENPGPKAYIDHFLGLMNKQILNRKSYTDIVISNDDIHVMGVDVLIGGIMSPVTTLYILLGILVNHSEFQDMAFEEITSVLGERTPRIEDKRSLPFIEALILETFRYASFVPFLMPHYTKKGGELNGYFIPENTAIFPNIWNLHHDERYWKNPWKFDPLRFIENDAISLTAKNNKQRILVHSAGRRQCPGEQVAKNRLFILVTMMLQKYKFLAAEGFPKPKHDPREYVNDVILKIKPYHLCVEARS